MIQISGQNVSQLTSLISTFQLFVSYILLFYRNMYYLYINNVVVHVGIPYNLFFDP